MTKVNYRTCDVCGNILKTDIRFRGHINGCHIWNKLFNGIDICNDCADKIKYLSIDSKVEKECINEFFKNEKEYDDPDLQSAYYTGLDDALNILSHNRLREIKVSRK